MDLLREQLERTFDLADSIPVQEEEVRAHYARYLCVATCGFMEEAISALLIGHTRRRASVQVQSYVEDRLYYFQNPKTGAIADLLGAFDRSWRDAFESVAIDEVKEAVNSIVGLRHKVAHGVSVPVSLDTVRRYRDEIFRLTDRMCDLLDPR